MLGQSLVIFDKILDFHLLFLDKSRKKISIFLYISLFLLTKKKKKFFLLLTIVRRNVSLGRGLTTNVADNAQKPAPSLRRA
jgi:hypothetical protein